MLFFFSKKISFGGIFRTLKYRNYKLYFSGQSISLIGTWLQLIALSWLVYKITGSAFILGLVGFFNRIPSFILAPLAGVLADRWNKYKLLFIIQIISMVQASLLAVLVLSNTIEVWHIYILSIIGGISNAFDLPVRQSFLIELIEDKSDLSNAIALNSFLVNFARLLGPSIAGVLLSIIGEGWCFLLNAFSFIAIIACLIAMKIEIKTMLVSKSGIINDLKDSFRYALGFPPFRSLLLLLALVSLMGMPFQVLMPVFAKDILRGGANTLGILMSAVGVGALSAAIYMASRKSVRGLGRVLAISTFVFGTGLAFFAASRTFWLSAFFLVFVGFGMMIQMSGSNTLFQTMVDDDKRGRIMSFYTMALMGMAPFGSLLAGSLSKTIGVSNTILFGGVCCIIASAYFYSKLPVIRQYSRPIYIRKGIIREEVNS